MTAPNFTGIVLTDEGVERTVVVLHPEVVDSLDAEPPGDESGADDEREDER